MKEFNLISSPFWQKKDLGKAIPQSPHAVSVALPTWKDIIDYEEKDPDCIRSLTSIYPRFGLNPLIQEIAQKALVKGNLKDWTAWPYPNKSCATKAQDYCLNNSNNCSTEIFDVLGLKCLVADKDATPAAKSFWQHTGLGASSRLAAIALNKEYNPSPVEGVKAREVLQIRLGKIYQCNKNLISLHPSGMAALTTALEVINTIKPGGATVQIGFPYVDVLKLPQVIFNGGILLEETNPNNIEKKLELYQPAAVIIELPSNPMLRSVDIKKISEIAHSKGIPVIIDDTIGSAVNVDVIPYADLIFSSLTKSFAGKGDIMAGSLVVSPFSNWEKEFREIISSNSIAELSAPDSIALEKSSRDIEVRIPQLNHSCLALKTKLEDHPNIKEIFHPEFCPNFRQMMRRNAGYGCLLSFELKGGLEQAQKVYDNLQVCKGPSFGTNFTLASPYVLLAHYNELSWAEKCGIPPHLLRISVGLEKEEDLWARFKQALTA